ncbi:hypothetical protein QYS49_18880 [Marivirga salinae]|uniref:Endonuclease n=1 Tax=Marivirga salinarum TaxID=3059078 RepID=A0AA49GCZ9_9BACT|nr:hypothetical protein [Marivirga sp. BDSF4-3]WKK78522.1 hypothetical protein QYS49_18880 [Marivirga sp. BDSF4-3]
MGYTSDLPNRMDSHNIYPKEGSTAKYREILFTEDSDIKKSNH